MVKAGYSEIGLAAVYITMQILLELHLIDRINLDDGFVHYEIENMGRGTAKHHHHYMICINYGKMTSSWGDLLGEF